MSRYRPGIGWCPVLAPEPAWLPRPGRPGRPDQVAGHHHLVESTSGLLRASSRTRIAGEQAVFDLVPLCLGPWWVGGTRPFFISGGPWVASSAQFLQLQLPGQAGALLPSCSWQFARVPGRYAAAELAVARVERPEPPCPRHQRRMLSTAKAAVSWSVPTLTQASFWATIVHPIRTDPAQIRDIQEVMHQPLAPGAPLGRNSPPPTVLRVRASGTSSFFFVSTGDSPAVSSGRVAVAPPGPSAQTWALAGPGVPSPPGSCDWLASYSPCRGAVRRPCDG